MNKANTRGEDLDDISMTAQELHVLSELDSRQYGYLLLQLPENEKKRELVLKVQSKPMYIFTFYQRCFSGC
jgi:hypothetical protein